FTKIVSIRITRRIGSRTNNPIPAMTTCAPLGNGVRSLNNDSTSPAPITTDASHVPTFNTRARSGSMRTGLIFLLLTPSSCPGLCRRHPATFARSERLELPQTVCEFGRLKWTLENGRRGLHQRLNPRRRDRQSVQRYCLGQDTCPRWPRLSRRS